MKKTWWIYVVFAVVCILGGVADIVLNDEVELGIFLIVFGVIFAPLLVLFASIGQKNSVKTMPLVSDETKETYIFDEDKVTILQQLRDDYYGSIITKYMYLFNVTETATHYFLYISRNHAHVVPKDSLVEGSLEQLNEIFLRQLGNKFKPYKK